MGTPEEGMRYCHIDSGREVPLSSAGEDASGSLLVHLIDSPWLLLHCRGDRPN